MPRYLPHHGNWYLGAATSHQVEGSNDTVGALGVQLQERAAVNEFPDGSNLVCMKPFTELEEIDPLKVERIKLQLNVEKSVSSLSTVEKGIHGPRSSPNRRRYRRW